MYPGEEYQARVEVRKTALDNLIHVGMEPECLKGIILSKVTLGRKMDVLKRALTYEPVADVESL